MRAYTLSTETEGASISMKFWTACLVAAVENRRIEGARQFSRQVAGAAAVRA